MKKHAALLYLLFSLHSLLAQEIQVVFSSNLDNTAGANAADIKGADVYSAYFNPANGTVRQLTRLTNTPTTPETFACLSLDKQWVAYNSSVNNIQEVHLLHLASRKVFKIFNGRFPEWRSANELLVTKVADSIQDVYLLTLDLSQNEPKVLTEQRLTDRTRCPGTSIGSDAFPFNGNGIIFNTLRPSGQTGAAVATVKLDGTGFRFLTDFDGSGHSIATADGQNIFCASSQTGKPLRLELQTDGSFKRTELPLSTFGTDLAKYDARFAKINIGALVYVAFGGDERSVFYTARASNTSTAVSRILWVKFNATWGVEKIVDFSSLIEQLANKTGKDFETISARSNSTPKPPALYLNFVTHNELTDPVDYVNNATAFQQQAALLTQFANLVNAKKAKWNYQSCSKFIVGTLKNQNAARTNTDILETLDKSAYIDVDPRGKTDFIYRYNYADVVKLLDSIGVSDSKTVGGFIASPSNMADWEVFKNPIAPSQIRTAKTWQAEILWGGGSLGHTSDVSNFGVWKPQDKNNFLTHDPNGKLWVVGNGCSNVLFANTDPDSILRNIQHWVSLIQSGSLPADKFYSVTIMTNQRDFSTAYMAKIAYLLEAIAPMVDRGEVVWATIREKFQAFQMWAAQNNMSYSQLSCAAVPSLSVSTKSSLMDESTNAFVPYQLHWQNGQLLLTNHTMQALQYQLLSLDGRLMYQGSTVEEATSTLPTQGLPNGFYVLSLYGPRGRQVQKVSIFHP